VKRVFPIFNAVVAITAGVIVLLGYFIDVSPLPAMRIFIMSIAVLVAGVAVVIGVGNLFSVHFEKIRQRKPGAVNSVVLLVAFMITFVVVLVSNSPSPLQNIVQGIQTVLLNGIMVPTEISLMAILAVTLLYASVRMLRWRIDFRTILFLVTAQLVLAGIGPWPVIGQIPYLGSYIQILAAGGARGILLGVALGTLTAGLRILFGADRPYGGK
jgi:NADH:ubiquinone oxidoreductase subunit 6 (subunit J)